MPPGSDEPLHDLTPLRRLNLNLLYALDAILRGRTLTEAGRIVSLSQPAMSLALRKLRENFNDELIVYDGTSRCLTTLATALRPRVRHLLQEADDTFGFNLAFDPATARQTISIAAPEAIELMYLSRVAPAILREGAGLDVRLVPFDYRAPAAMFEQHFDIVIVPESMLDPRLDRLLLFDHRLTCLVWEDHPDIKNDRMTRDQYRGARHAAMFEQMEVAAAMGSAMPQDLAERRIVVRTGLYAMLPNLIIDTDLVVTTSNWLSQYLAYHFPLRLVVPPFSAQPMNVFAQWKSHRRDEPMIRWLIGHLQNALHDNGG